MCIKIYKNCPHILIYLLISPTATHYPEILCIKPNKVVQKWLLLSFCHLLDPHYLQTKNADVLV